MEASKRNYKDHFAQLKSLKEEIETMQHLLEKQVLLYHLASILSLCQFVAIYTSMTFSTS